MGKFTEHQLKKIHHVIISGNKVYKYLVPTMSFVGKNGKKVSVPTIHNLMTTKDVCAFELFYLFTKL